MTVPRPPTNGSKLPAAASIRVGDTPAALSQQVRRGCTDACTAAG
jgi:hypothetical protein